MLFRHFLLSLLTLITVGAAIIPEKFRRDHVPESKTNLQGGQFPPGYPKTEYRYQVRFSNITLACTFRYKPRIKQYQVDAVLKRSMLRFSDPRKQDDEVYQGVARAWDTHKSDENEGVTYLTIRVNVRNRREMTYGDAVDAIIGVNRIRLQWPKLDMGCRIHNIFQGRDVDLGDIELYYDPRANPYLVTTA
ncbi:MAG: hypothetical protein Q9176_005455 [Flavoplaca citrina]